MSAAQLTQVTPFQNGVSAPASAQVWQTLLVSYVSPHFSTHAAPVLSQKVPPSESWPQALQVLSVVSQTGLAWLPAKQLVQLLMVAFQYGAAASASAQAWQMFLRSWVSPHSATHARTERSASQYGVSGVAVAHAWHSWFRAFQTGAAGSAAAQLWHSSFFQTGVAGSASAQVWQTLLVSLTA